MKPRTLIFQSFRHYWRTHLGVLLGVALAALVLTGALMVGDSVKATLRAQAEARVGQVGDAMICGERFLPWSSSAQAIYRSYALPLPFRLRQDTMGEGAGILMSQGTAERPDGSARANRVQILGVDEAFWKLSPSGETLRFGVAPSAQETEAFLNQRLAAQLGLAAGDAISLRFEKPGAFSKDAPLSGEDDGTVLLRAKVARVVDDAHFGRFALTSGQVPTPTVYVPLAALQGKLGLGQKVNVVLERAVVPPKFRPSSALDEIKAFFGIKPRKQMAATMPLADLRFDKAASSADGNRKGEAISPLRLEAFDLKVAEVPGGRFELRSPRVFLDPAIVSAAHAWSREHQRAGSGLDALTYFVTELRAGDGMNPQAKATPYSMVTALDAPASGLAQAELAEDEIQITRWLADDLGVDAGDKLTLKYFVMGERRQLVEKARTFTVLGPIIEMNDPQLSTSWMPDFPNVPDKDGLKKWKPGFPFAAERTRKKDEDYWAQYRGTPKAFVNLRVGQEMWGNRWGNLTSIRYPAGVTRKEVESIAEGVNAAALGFRAVPLREQALAGTDAPVDFGQLFGGFSFFLIIAAAVLTGLLFTFSIEQRAAEAGLLLAVGWKAKAVRRSFLREGLFVALLGSLLGAAGAALYTKLVLDALAGVWSGATGGTQFVFAVSPLTVTIGMVSGILVAWLAMWWASRRLFRREAAQLLAGQVEESDASALSAGANRKGFVVAAALAVIAVALAALAKGNPGAFFGAGSLLLIAGLLTSRSALRRVAQGKGVASIPQLGARNTSRRSGRSLATIAVLASGVFMVVAVDSFRKGPLDDVARRDSGTGGFALVGESSAPIYEDLNSQSGREKLLPDYDKLPVGLHIVPFRVRDGDDASCLNLNRAVQPRLLGVRPEELAQRFRFNAPAGVDWNVLTATGEEVPGIVDANTLQWAMQKKIGDLIEYTDERGQPMKVKIAATVSGSMLQGQVVISEQRFVERFPNAAGYRFFLIDCPPAQTQAVREQLSQQLSDRGLELVSAAQRLADFNAVENTYLSIFQVLGGLGMLLGSAGLGIVVARNVLERRREFGLLEAVGFTPRQLRGLVWSEHRWLIVGSLAIGGLSALVAVFPQLLQKGGSFPWGPLALLFGGMALIGAACAWAATRLALRGTQLPALRSE